MYKSHKPKIFPCTKYVNINGHPGIDRLIGLKAASSLTNRAFLSSCIFFIINVFHFLMSNTSIQNKQRARLLLYLNNKNDGFLNLFILSIYKKNYCTYM